MNDSLRSSAKVAREFLETIAEGIGRLESNSGALSRMGGQLASRGSDLTRAGAKALTSLPARFRGTRSSTQVIGALVIAGVVASTAALIYMKTRDRDSRGRRR